MNTKINDDLINHLSEIVYKYILSCIFVIVTADFFGDPIDLIILGICIAYVVETIVMLGDIWRSRK